MANYYEIINVSRDATPSEIEEALDRHYNQIRKLITHHDPSVVNQANLDLQILEKIRSTLMDQGKRSAYDAAIDPLIGGLGDLGMNQYSSAPMSGPLIKPSQPYLSSPQSQPLSHAPSQRIWI